MFPDSVLERNDDLLRSITKKWVGIPLYLLVSVITFGGATDARSAVSVEFTSVPPYGSPNNLLGKVHGVEPARYRVAVFIYIDGLGWWTKPTCANPLTTIQPDGTWSADITTGGVDSNATRIAAHVVPTNFSPPCVTNAFCLPDQIQQQSIANALVTR